MTRSERLEEKRAEREERHTKIVTVLTGCNLVALVGNYVLLLTAV